MTKVSKINLPRWDYGPTTLAATGDASERLAAFKEWLAKNPSVLKPKDNEKPAAALARAAMRFTIERRNLTVIEPRGERDMETGRLVNPNGVKGARRRCWAEFYAMKGKLTPSQLKAALAILSVTEATQRSAPAIKAIQVDTSPKPDANVAIQVDRQGKFHAVVKHIPASHRAYIDHVVMQNRPITAMAGCKGRRVETYFARLAEGLQIVAERLGYAPPSIDAETKS